MAQCRTKGSGSITRVCSKGKDEHDKDGQGNFIHTNECVDTWRLRWEVPSPNPNKRRKWESATIHGSRSKADRMLREKVGEVDRAIKIGQYVHKNKQTVGNISKSG
jgi:hypothetical protein